MTVGANFDKSVTLQGYYLQTDRTTGATTKIIFGSDVVDRRNRIVSSVSTSNFAKRKFDNTLPINAYSKSTLEIYDPLFPFLDTWQSGSISSREYHRSVMGSWGGAPTLFTAQQSATADDPTQRMVGRLLNELRTSKTNSMVTLAEAHKTAALVANSATKIYTAIKALKSLRFGDFARALTLKGNLGSRGFKSPSRGRSSSKQSQDWMADTWLEYSYGWKPLLKDVYDSAEALASYMTNHGNVVRCARSKTKTRASGNWKRSFPEEDYFKSDVHERWIEMAIFYKIPDGQISLANACGLNNPLELAWELIPFSFVADWFLPVGEALRNLTATSGLTFAGGFKTVREVRTTDYKMVGSGRPVLSGGVYHVFTGTGRSFRKDFSMSRSILTTFPSYGFPRFKDPRSFAHAASAIALLQSLFLRK